ncbi:uncharacterized protein K02A2.6-like [Coccinella septempunctata]|uniref:uncharacterized protein K02A2.6-like n=1 Tax=Coccinella septempunctata TaxID=41139 RepID=UPI001D071168|nr:uncharacterized protein K02A2.6-like [Coccinella septempunctata]
MELRNRLLEKEDMTLDQVEKLARTLESVSQQSNAITGHSVSPSQNSSLVCRTPHTNSQKRGKKESDNSQSFGSSTRFTCFCCGNEGHRSRYPQCPARSVICKKCKKKGHFAKVCKSRSQLNESKAKESQPSSSSVKVVCDENVFCVRNLIEPNDELVTCHFGGVPTETFIDSGTKWTMMSKKTWNMLYRKGVRFLSYVPNPDVNFFDASGRVKYSVLQTVHIELQIGENIQTAEVIVFKEHIQTLLGRVDAKALGVLRVGLNATKDLYVRVVSTPIKEPLSKLKEFQLQIPIDKSVPPVIQPVRRIPFALRTRIEEQINELLRLYIIERVEGASPWVSPIVPVPKGPNEIRLCVDMRRANEAVLHEKHPIPVIDDIAPLLKDVTVFSKVDLKQAYHQIELAPESREVTTFGTHLGLFRYKRLMFELKCAPEMFQRILENILSGLKGVFNYLDDLLIFGRTLEEHDANLKAVLQRL